MDNCTVNPPIDNLKKITLSISAGTSAQNPDIFDQPQTFSFIFGLGTDGLTPFEYALAGKSVGDIVSLQLKSVDLQRIFRHINPPFLSSLVDQAEIFLTASITTVAAAESREVIRAMAAMAECGGGCDCGCGCGVETDTPYGPDRH
jgi:hypothetical protein